MFCFVVPGNLDVVGGRKQAFVNNIITPQKGTMMTRTVSLFSALAICSIIVSTAHAADCDYTCMASVAAKVDTEVATLSPADRAIIERIKPALDSADMSKLDSIQAKLGRAPGWRIENTEHRALWNEIAYTAIGYASTTHDCSARGLWLMHYTNTWGKSEAWDEREARYNRAQYYLAARHGKGGGYLCKK